MRALENQKIIYVSAAALIDSEQRVLLAQRPEGRPMAGMWEFPGGKIESDERPEAALVRELDEELGVTVLASDLLPLTFASHDYGDFYLFMPVFLCRTWQGTPASKESQELVWVKGEELENYNMPPADIPLIPVLQEVLK